MIPTPTALKNWSIGTIRACEPVSDGLRAGGSPRLWRVSTAGGAYYLKTGRDVARLKTEISVLRTLGDNNIPVSLPLTTIAQTDYVEENDRWYVLTQEIHGTGVTEHFDVGHLERAHYFGQIIGQLHNGLRKCEGVIDSKDSDIYKTVSTWAIPKVRDRISPQLLPQIDKIIRDYEENFGRLVPHLPKQLIHRDMHTQNMLFKNGVLVGFIDFELHERNVRIFDPCYCATSILSGVIDQPDKLKKWSRIFSSIIQGYDSVDKLSPIEKESLWYVLISIQLIFMAFCYEGGYVDAANQNRKGLEWIYHNKALLNSPAILFHETPSRVGVNDKSNG